MYIYIAGPYTGGAPDGNLRAAADAAEAIHEKGHTPFIPHTSFLWGIVHEHDYEFWMDWCFEWLDTCDALLRLDGHSPGADREVEYAKEHGIDVYHSLDDIPEDDD